MTSAGKSDSGKNGQREVPRRMNKQGIAICIVFLYLNNAAILAMLPECG
jgi:hypothetical protein